jgi:hypothetical protein
MEEVRMGLRKALVICSLILALTLLFADLVVAQMNPVYRFKGVNIPVSLRIKNAVLKKGVYDLEFVRASSPVLYYLRIWQQGKILHALQGEEWPYGSGIVSDIAKNRDIPDKPTLKMTRNATEKLLTVIFESGRWAKRYPMIRAKFKFQYEE